MLMRSFVSEVGDSTLELFIINSEQSNFSMVVFQLVVSHFGRYHQGGEKPDITMCLVANEEESILLTVKCNYFSNHN